jgi:plasmid stability protein
MSFLLGIDSFAFIEYIDCIAIESDFDMVSLTVRNIPEDAKYRFRQVAAAHGRSMEEHLRQLVINAEFEGEAPAQGVRDVAQSFKHFEPEPSRESWVRELVQKAVSDDEDYFSRGKYADIRFLSAKDAMAELRRLANGVGFDLPPRLNTTREAPEF